MYFTPNFLPCIITFSKILQSDEVFLNESDVYYKQSYRNRTTILTANKVENLIVPVHASSGKTNIRDVKIDNGSAWQRTMWRTLQTAYRNSVYFGYYDYVFEPLFHSRYGFLCDLQEDSIRICLKAMQIQKNISWKKHDNISGIFEAPAKHTDSFVQEFSLKPYNHTFGNVFVPNLSVTDLLFSKGPEAIDFLTNK